MAGKATIYRYVGRVETSLCFYIIEFYDWAMRIAARRGRAKACVALARKLAGILYALWRDETEFDPQALRHSDAAAAA